MIGYVHSIESFGTVDGPGTRFVIFLKGCNMRCLYCHNPDTWTINGSKKMSVEEIYKQYQGVEEYITGGITVSGGEALLQLDFLIELFKYFKEKNVHVCLDTSGSTFSYENKKILKKFDELIKYIDLVLLDIKHIDEEEHIKLTKYTSYNSKEFLKYLDENKVDTWIRHVIIPEYTLNDKYLFQLGTYLANFNNITGIEVLPYHTMAIPKYEELKIEYPLMGVRDATKDEAIRARKIIFLAMNNNK